MRDLVVAAVGVLAGLGGGILLIGALELAERAGKAPPAVAAILRRRADVRGVMAAAMFATAGMMVGVL